MRLAVVLAALVLAASSVAEAQRQPRPYEAFAGQGDGEDVCDPVGSTSTMAICFGMWVHQEEALLQVSVDRLLAYAREQETQRPLFAGEGGYVGSITRAQDNWLDWRNAECSLMTLDDVAGSIRRISYPNCQASLTAQRRRQLDAVLAFWQDEFRDERGEASGVSCVLAPEAFHHCPH